MVMTVYIEFVEGTHAYYLLSGLVILNQIPLQIFE